MNRDVLLAERERLIQVRTQAIANANACNGALQLIEQLIAAEDEPRILVPTVK